MKQALIYKLLSILSTLTGKFFLYITPSENNQLGMTAVQDKQGVWYVGNVYDKNDITYGIAQNGHTEANETDLLNVILPLITPDSGDLSFYDVGANIGYYGLLAAKAYGATVESFEPLSEYSDCIKKSSNINGISDHFRIHKLALSDKKDVVEFTKAGSGSSLEKDFNELPDLEKISVPTDTLDNIYKEKNLAKPDFIKIDVEGHEFSTLKGGEKTINESKPVIFLELCSTLKDIGRSYVNPYYKDTITFFIKNNYEIYCIREKKQLEKWSGKKTINKAGMFLCLEKNKHNSIKERLFSTYKIID